MARKSGIRPMFKMSDIKKVLDQFQEQLDFKILSSLQYIGEEFVNKAREKKPYEKGIKVSYQDHTANLRSSIGYIILKDGDVVFKDFKGESQQGMSKGESFAKKVALEHPSGWVLIGVAGMEYAAAVEAKNYDVITGSAPTNEMIMSILRKIKP